jgi:peroxiredoxin
LAALWISTVAAPGRGGAQDPQPAQSSGVQKPAPEETLQTINDDYCRQLLQLDRTRLDRISRLAARQDPATAASTYEQLFRLAVAANLFQDAEPAANAVITSGSSSPATVGLAHLVKIVAQADRGAYEESLASLKHALAGAETNKASAPGAALSTPELMGICDAYFQRLVHSNQIETARKAFQLGYDHSQRPALKEFLANRLKRLELVGKPAPEIVGKDVDGKPFRLADTRGKVVLVQFWASWCLPCGEEVEWLQKATQTYRDRGFEVVGINLDALQDSIQRIETVLPNVRRFLIEHNVRWPNLISGTAENDYASSYAVTDIPANYVIGKDGTIRQIDVVRKNLDEVIARELGR